MRMRHAIATTRRSRRSCRTSVQLIDVDQGKLLEKIRLDQLPETADARGVTVTDAKRKRTRTLGTIGCHAIADGWIYVQSASGFKADGVQP
jgi:hypothetical protein